MDIIAKIKNDMITLEDWLSLELAQTAAFFKPILQEIEAVGKKDLLTDIALDAPLVAAAYVAGGPVAAIASATASVETQLKQQAVSLSQQTVTAIAAGLAAQATANLPEVANQAAPQNAMVDAQGQTIATVSSDTTEADVAAMNAGHVAALAANSSS